ncbi:pyrroline-5-carboxylate reductase [Membranihabitans marinus]|uniref:pyrroline-5-carboxylate reductase n=1 Tax=Membranihabitans marinus TaxID=1227546 RepID=UPI001F028679|nr:pyrroline-5-carboxylate reductase [Membranihabitans marinus]
MKVLVIGGGNMGLTYANGISKSGFLSQNDLMIMDASIEKVTELKAIGGFLVFDNLDDCISNADVIIIAVKPYHADSLMTSIKDKINQDQIFVSLMAGVTIKTIQEGLGVKKVIRTMPNLPAQVSKGVTSYTGPDSITDSEYGDIHQLLSTTGMALKVNSEREIDATTGISGSGPAYVFYFMEAMMKAAEDMGFSKENASEIVAQTFDGAVTLFKENTITPAEWMQRVASKGGTTEAALNTLKNDNVSELIQKAAFAAFNRAEELGKK